MTHFIKPKLILLIALCSAQNALIAQNNQQAQMQRLNFMVGEWIGTSKLYQEGKVMKEIPAFEHIQYDVDQHLLVIQLNSESLQLHTIIRYDEQDSTFYYYPFSKGGTGRYPAEFRDGQLVVKSSETRRFIFSPIAEGGFREYGEELINGRWVMYFEDVFTNTK